jgi:hypothetical protein
VGLLGQAGSRRWGRCDDHAADEEEIDAEGAVVEERQVIGEAIFCFDSVEAGEYDEEGREPATYLTVSTEGGSEDLEGGAGRWIEGWIEG